MSVLSSSGLSIATKLFIKWDPHDHESGLIPAMVTAIKMGTDLNPYCLEVEITRLQGVAGEDSSALFALQQREGEAMPSLTFAKTGMDATWSLPPGAAVQSRITAPMSGNHLATTGVNGDLFRSYTRPIRVLSSRVQNVLGRFPPVSAKATQVNANMIRQDLRADTSCTLLEWESLVIYVTRTLNIPIEHSPPYIALDVPRYDECEMRISFSTFHSLLKVFRHLTAKDVLKMVVKTKKRRRRHTRGKKQLSMGREGDILQLVGNFVCQQDGFAFTVGSMFNMGIPGTSRLQYPVLYRHTNDWDNRDRKYVHDLSLKYMTYDLLRPLQESADEVEKREEPEPRAGRKRVNESFMGFKWIRAKEEDTRMHFHSFNPNEVNGTLHFCVSSTVFVGPYYVSEITRLCKDGLRDFNLSF